MLPSASSLKRGTCSARNGNFMGITSLCVSACGFLEIQSIKIPGSYDVNRYWSDIAYINGETIDFLRLGIPLYRLKEGQLHIPTIGVGATEGTFLDSDRTQAAILATTLVNPGSLWANRSLLFIIPQSIDRDLPASPLICSRQHPNKAFHSTQVYSTD